MHFGFMDVMLLHSGHRHVSATHGHQTDMSVYSSFVNGLGIQW